MPWWYLKKIYEQPFEKKRKLMTTTYFPFLWLCEVETTERSGKITLNKHVYIGCELMIGCSS